MANSKEITPGMDLANEFQKAVTPEKVSDPEQMFLFKCPECGNVHFRHAGYVETLMPFIRADRQKTVSCESFGVRVCTKCRHCYVWYNEQMRDVTDLIDLNAWEKTEKEMQKATGPGGEC